MFCATNETPALTGGQSIGGNRDRDSRRHHLARAVAALIASEDGQDLVEYGLLAVLIALVGLASFTTFNGSVSQKIVNEFNTLGSYL